MSEISGGIVVVDLAIGIISGLASGFAGSYAARLWRLRRIDDYAEPKNVNDDGSIKYTLTNYYDGSGYKCPACAVIHIGAAKEEIVNNLNICGCFEYPQMHFHWNCPTCKFKAIMRTADSK